MSGGGGRAEVERPREGEVRRPKQRAGETANIFAAVALWWCLTNGGYTALAFSRVNQYANFMDAVEQTPEMASPLVFDVLNYDAANVQAQQQQKLLQEFPDGSSRDPDAMQRGFERFPPEYESELQLNATVSAAAFSPRRKGKHSYRGGVFYIPDVQANSSQPASTPSTAPSTPNPTTPPTNALATGTSGTPSGSAAQSSSGTINTNRGFLFRCFGPSPTN
uniref:Peptidylprolyl isomerase n=1 Tax=Oryza barthii TaxID=65489 RepID=A0A0D3EQ92_9ORYZ